jgi:hypothetical protein
MKFATDRSYADPEKAAHKLVEIANAIETIQDAPLPFEHKASPAEYKTGLDLAIKRGWLVLHDSGTFAKFTPAGAELFA